MAVKAAAKQDPTVCTRCKGTGRVSSPVMQGRCFGCWGKGTRAAQLAIKAEAEAQARRIAETETVSVLIHVAEDSERAAQIEYLESFVGLDRSLWISGPILYRLAPGWFAGEVLMHVESTLAWLAK